MNWQAYLILANNAADIAIKLYEELSKNPSVPEEVKVALAARAESLKATAAAVAAFEP